MEMKICAIENMIEKAISGMLAIIIPENRKNTEGITESSKAFTIPFFLQSTSQIRKYESTSAPFVIK